MRRRLLVLIVAIVLAIVTGFIGRGTDITAFDMIAGIAWLTAIILGITLLPFWPRVLPDTPPMNGLFQRPLEGQRWCTACGTVADAQAACSICGGLPKLPKQKPAKPAKPRKAKQ